MCTGSECTANVEVRDRDGTVGTRSILESTAGALNIVVLRVQLIHMVHR